MGLMLENGSEVERNVKVFSHGLIEYGSDTEGSVGSTIYSLLFPHLDIHASSSSKATTSPVNNEKIKLYHSMCGTRDVL